MRKSLLALLAVVLVSCGKSEVSSNVDPLAGYSEQAASSPDHLAKIAERRNRTKHHAAMPFGYNYTDTYIDSFEVNGFGGGNLEVSTPTAGGGKQACCLSLVGKLPAGTEFTVTWTRDRKRWCEQTVRLAKPGPSDPLYLEVHFYQDGHIEVEASLEFSDPRLKLERVSYARRHETGNVNNDEKFSRCKDGFD